MMRLTTGTEVTWIEPASFKDKRTSRLSAGARVITGTIIGAKDGGEGCTSFEIEVDFASGQGLEAVRDRLWRDENTLRLGAAEEWQHSRRVRPYELLEKRYRRETRALHQIIRKLTKLAGCAG